MWIIFGAILTIIDMCLHTHFFSTYMGIQLGILAIIFIVVILSLAFS